MKKNRKKQKYYDLIFTFNYVNVLCQINTEIYDKEDQIKIRKIIKDASKEILIDKSYVDFKENKHEDTFLLEEGWNNLCKLVIDTNFCKKISKEQYEVLIESYSMMIICYICLFLENFGYNTDEITLIIDTKSSFMVQYQKDTIQEWKKYPGKWTSW